MVESLSDSVRAKILFDLALERERLLLDFDELERVTAAWCPRRHRPLSKAEIRALKVRTMAKVTKIENRIFLLRQRPLL